MGKIYEINAVSNWTKDEIGRTFEINSKSSGTLNPSSPIVKVFSAMAFGKEVGDVRDKDGISVSKQCISIIKELNERADKGDRSAISEINTIRTYTVEPLVLEELKLMGFFGDFEPIGYDETVKRKVTKQSLNSRGQALNGDVPFSFNYSDEYTVPTTSLGAGYEVDYRKAQYGDMSAENRLIQNIQTDLMNRAKAYAFDKVINSVKGATVKNVVQGITHANVQGVIDKARPFGKVTLIGDTSAVVKLNAIATYADAQVTPYLNISQEAMNEIRNNGYVSALMGCLVYGVDNAYDLTKLNAEGTWFNKISNDRYIYVVPTGIESPIKLWTRGGLTSFTSNDASNGKILTRYDIEVAADIAKGEEYKIGLIDTAS